MLSYNVLNSWVEKLMKKDLPVKIKTSDITSLSTKDINKLKAGDIVLKKTGNQKHTYIVSYKENNQGICLTYADATVIETVSYDYDTTTKTWVYNSTDIGRVGGVEYSAGTGISITDGVIANTKPYDQLYIHNVKLAYQSYGIAEIEFISTKSTYTKDEFMAVIQSYPANSPLAATGSYKGLYDTNSYLNIYGVSRGNLSDQIGFIGEKITVNFSNSTVTIEQQSITGIGTSTVTFVINSKAIN